MWPDRLTSELLSRPHHMMSAICAAIGLIAVLAFARRINAARTDDRYRRGAIVKYSRVRYQNRARSLKRITLAGVPIAAADETKHFKLIGATGTGKSTAIRQLMKAALERGDRAVITDPEGAFLRCLGRRYRGDV